MAFHCAEVLKAIRGGAMVGFLSEHICLCAGKTQHLRAVFSTALPPPSREAPPACLLLFSPSCFSTCTSSPMQLHPSWQTQCPPRCQGSTTSINSLEPRCLTPRPSRAPPGLTSVCDQLGSFDPWVVLRGSGACLWLPLYVLFFTKQPEWNRS